MKYLLIIVLAFFITNFSFAQILKNKENPIKTEGLEICYKWKPSKFFNKKSPLQLNVKVKNTNNYCVKISLKVSYFKSGILQEESDTVTNCINPLKTAGGGKKGLNFSAGNFTNDEIRSEDFSFEIIPLEIIKMRSCK